MIGIRPVLSAVAVGAALSIGLGSGADPPEVELGARFMVEAAADRADASLAAMAAAVEPAVDAARAASARVVAGDEDPRPVVAEAAELAAAAEASAAEARRAIDALNRARRAGRPDVDELRPATEPGELGSIAAQLQSSADDANEFAAMRRRAAAVAPALEAALTALDAGDLARARASAVEARTAHDAVVEWDVELDTLPVWVDTTDAMIGAVETIVTATDAGDRAAAEAAANDFASVREDAATADRALRIAISEGGGAVLAAPLGRLASVLASIEEARASVAAIGEGVGA